MNKNSKLFSLEPYVNEKKILCVVGGINAGNLPKESKNQMIVSESHHLSCLIIMDPTLNNLMFISVERKPYIYNEIFIGYHLAEDLLEKY